MKTKRKSSILVIMLLIISMVVLSGCGGTKAKPEDALSATVNLLQNRDFAGYAKVTGTDKDDVEKIYNKVYKSADSLGLGKEYYEGLYKKIYAKTKYEVKDTKEESDGKYILTVEVEPLKLFASDPDKISSDFDTFMKEERKKMDNGEVSYTSDEFAKEMMKTVLNSAAETVEKAPKYGKKKTIKVEVFTDKEGHVTMDEKNANNFISSLLDSSGIENLF